MDIIEATRDVLRYWWGIIREITAKDYETVLLLIAFISTLGSSFMLLDPEPPDLSFIAQLKSLDLGGPWDYLELYASSKAAMLYLLLTSSLLIYVFLRSIQVKNWLSGLRTWEPQEYTDRLRPVSIVIFLSIGFFVLGNLSRIMTTTRISSVLYMLGLRGFTLFQVYGPGIRTVTDCVMGLAIGTLLCPLGQMLVAKRLEQLKAGLVDDFAPNENFHYKDFLDVPNGKDTYQIKEICEDKLHELEDNAKSNEAKARTLHQDRRNIVKAYKIWSAPRKDMICRWGFKSLGGPQKVLLYPPYRENQHSGPRRLQIDRVAEHCFTCHEKIHIWRQGGDTWFSTDPSLPKVPLEPKIRTYIQIQFPMDEDWIVIQCYGESHIEKKGEHLFHVFFGQANNVNANSQLQLHTRWGYRTEIICEDVNGDQHTELLILECHPLKFS